ncbi:MAG: hypothetical protein QM734_15510 [Cyclobacteriaceae bacterium]
MTELKEILEKSLTDDSCMSITIHSNIPKLTLRITDSRQMYIYGIGLDKQQGFTLNIGIDKNSNKGKKLRETLNESNFLTDFKSFEDKRSMIYLKDFRKEIELLEKTIHDLLDKFDNGSSRQSYQLTANRTDGNYTIE